MLKGERSTGSLERMSLSEFAEKFPTFICEPYMKRIIDFYDKNNHTYSFSIKNIKRKQNNDWIIFDESGGIDAE